MFIDHFFMDEITPQSSVQADSLILTVTSKLLMTFCVRDKIQKNDLEFRSILKRLKLQMKLNVSIVVRFTIIMQEKQVLHLCFII